MEFSFQVATTSGRTLAGIAVIVSSVEMVFLIQEFEEGGIWNPRLTRKVRQLGASNYGLPHWLVRRKVVTLNLLVRLLAGILLTISAGLQTSQALAVLAISVVVTSVWHYSILFGLDGADQMTLIVLAGLLVSTAGEYMASRTLIVAGLAFIALQCTLAYFVAGVTKLFGAKWRRGTAVPDIVRTRSYGQAWISRILDQRDWMGRAATYSVVIFEVGFPLIYLLPLEWATGVLGMGLLLHLSIAYVMGLNTFLWPFVAAYPSVLAFVSLART